VVDGLRIVSTIDATPYAMTLWYARYKNSRAVMVASNMIIA
jgi:hypothetical protein